MLKIAVGFDAIFTTDRWPSSNARSREGITEILSTLSFFSTIQIIATKPKHHTSTIWSWLKEESLEHFVEDIHCYSPQEKSSLIANMGFDLIIDSDSVEVAPAKKLVWQDQPWREFLIEIVSALSCLSPKLHGADNFLVSTIEYASHRSPWPVFILTAADGSKRKLRLCNDLSMKTRILHFLKATLLSGYPHVARLCDTSGLAILKTFIPGTSIQINQNAVYRRKIIEDIAIALAKLHNIPVDLDSIYPQDKGIGWPDDTSPVWLVCGADNFNTIMQNNGLVAFIDLEACTYGSRWADLSWSENLLCISDEESDLLIETYCKASNLDRPSEKNRQDGMMRYLNWLSTQLNRNVKEGLADESIYKNLLDIGRRIKSITL